MIFRVFQVYKSIREGVKNPTGFAYDEALGLLRAVILPPTIIGALMVVLFFLLGYTPFWFGPSGFFKVMSIITSLAWLIWFFITRILFIFTKQILRQAKQKADQKLYDVTP